MRRPRLAPPSSGRSSSSPIERMATATIRGRSSSLPARIILTSEPTCWAVKLSTRLPALFGLGNEAEAMNYGAENLEVWKATHGALDWLAKKRGALHSDHGDS